MNTTLNVHVIRGKDVPIRVDFFNEYVNKREGNKDDFFKEMMQIMTKFPQVQPFVEVKITDPDNDNEKMKTRMKRTATSDG